MYRIVKTVAVAVLFGLSMHSATAQTADERMYEYVEGKKAADKNDNAKAREWYEKAIAKGNATAMYQLGWLYDNGYHGVAKNEAKARELWSKARETYARAAERGNADGMYGMAILYHRGCGVTKDVDKAIEWYRKAAAKGSAEAMFAMGNLGYSFRDFNRFKADILNWWTQAANKGHVEAMYSLGFFYYEHESEDYVQARKWYTNAANKGHVQAMYRLGRIYYEGNGVSKNFVEARKWFAQAYDKENNESEKYLIRIDEYFADQNAEKVYEYAEGKKAFNRNKYDKIEYEKAREWFKKAADKGVEVAHQRIEEIDIMLAMNTPEFKSGLQAWEEDGIPEIAVSRWQKAAEKGNIAALINMADMYMRRLRQPNKAVECMAKAAELGYSKAMNDIAACYRFGTNGFSYDPAKARELLTKSANKGNYEAKYTLVKMKNE